MPIHMHRVVLSVERASVLRCRNVALGFAACNRPRAIAPSWPVQRSVRSVGSVRSVRNLDKKTGGSRMPLQAPGSGNLGAAVSWTSWTNLYPARNPHTRVPKRARARRNAHAPHMPKTSSLPATSLPHTTTCRPALGTDPERKRSMGLFRAVPLSSDPFMATPQSVLPLRRRQAQTAGGLEVG